MDTDLIRDFLVVAESKNFTLAASKMYIAQPALSKRIARLERYFGRQLFIRNRRQLELTTAGKKLFEDAPLFLRQSQNLYENIKNLPENVLTLRIAFLGAVARDFLPLLDKFKNKYKYIQLQLYTKSLKEINELLKQNKIDMAITLKNDGYILPEWKQEKLYTDGVALFLGKNQLFDEQLADFKQLAKEKFVIFSPAEAPESYKQIIRICAKWGFVPHIVQAAASIENVLFLVEAGLGIAILPKHAQNYASSNIKIIPLHEEKASLEIVAVYKKSAEKAVDYFLHEIRE